MNKKELIEKIVGSKKLLSDYSVNRIGLFGSYARGTQKKNSDVDLIVSFSEIPDLIKFINLQMALERKFKRKVDLVTEDGLKPVIKDDILKEVIWLEK